MSSEDPGKQAYTDIARAEIAAFEWLGRRVAVLWRMAVDLAWELRARVEAQIVKARSDWTVFQEWLALAVRAKGDQEHMAMAMHQQLLAGTVFNPFRLLSIVLAGVVLILTGLLGWQWTRAELLEAKNKSLSADNRTAVDRSWQWKAQADAARKAAAVAAKDTIQDGRARAVENERSTSVAKTVARRSEALARRQRERINDALLSQSSGGDAPVDLEQRLRDLAAPAGAAGDPAGAAAPGGDPAAGVPGRSDAAAGASAAAAAAGALGGAEGQRPGPVLEGPNAPR